MQEHEFDYSTSTVTLPVVQLHLIDYQSFCIIAVALCAYDLNSPPLNRSESF